MDLPLDAIEVGDDIAGVLSSPYISKRATKEDQIGVSRFDLYKDGNPQIKPEYEKAYRQTNRMYTQEMATLATGVLANVNDKLPENSKLFDKSGNTTEYGKYVLPLLD